MPVDSVLVVGAGRMGTALVAAFRAAGRDLPEAAGRGATGEGAQIVLLAVPDREIGPAARLIAPGRLVGHLSGATPLTALAPHLGFSIHPLTPVLGPQTRFEGIPAAVAGSSEQAVSCAHALARELGLSTFEVAEQDRVAYHAAACVASNFLVTLEDLAERLAATAGVPRHALVPLVRATADNWARHGAGALTGPIARGDDQTVAAHLESVRERLPEDVALFESLTEATHQLVRRSAG